MGYDPLKSKFPEALVKDVELYPDAYQREHAAPFKVCTKSIWQALKKWGITYKKNLRHPRADEDVRCTFQEKRDGYKEQGKSLGYLDESGFAKDMPRTHGYSPRGQRCSGLQNGQAKRRTNVIGALLGTVLMAIVLFSSPVNSDVFYAWVTQLLQPSLPPHCVIVMDNASFHKRQDIQLAIINAGHLIQYLLPYPPDLNPIEHKWAQAKSKRRDLNCDINTLFSEYMM
ncbi:IS630 family transposase [Candidatus Fukatsuia endosymbiont of Tuberolachnus salignus]|uniref:IS630 family transposase n=1 Tax=Candidatus Fukatsuia endosymbiont of Tuberolachnus salignus TaxID=3077957 RepID=UPI00313E2750